MDVSLLFIDSGYGIAPFFPVPGTTTDNRLSAGQTITTPRGRVTARTLGLEHMVVIAVQARPGEQPVDFSCLAQPTLPQAVARAAGTRSATIDSPLGRLLQFSLYRAGSERGMVRAALADHSLKVLSWEVAPAAAREDTNPTVTSWDGISWEKPVLYVAGIFLAATVVMVARRRAR